MRILVLSTSRQGLLHFAKVCCLVCGAASSLIFEPSYCLAQKSPEDRSLAKLCQLGLAESAERYAVRQRDLNSDAPALHARWTLRLMECQAQAALWEPEDSSEAWQRCRTTLDDFQAASPENARIPWLRWQLGRCWLLRAQANLARHLAAPGNETPRETALQQVREILAMMEYLEDDIARRQPIAARQLTSPRTEAPADQLARLKVDVGLLRCEALLIRSRLYPANSRDRRAAATDAETQAAAILGITGEDWESRGALEVARATANLELGKSQEALQVLAKLTRSDSPSLSARAAVIAIEYLTNHSQPSRAQGLLPLLSGPELALAKIRIGMADLAQTTDKNQRQQHLNELLRITQEVGGRYGSYWRNRAEALVLGSNSELSTSDTGANQELMLLEVRQLLAAGQDEEAIDRLLVFRDSQSARGNAAAAIRFALQASALLQRKQAWLPAAQATEKIALKHIGDSLASEAHFQAVFCVLQALRKAPSEQEIAQRYEDLLVQQLTLWPDSDESSQAQQWLAQWLTGKKRRQELAQVLLSQAKKSESTDVFRQTLSRWLALVLELPPTQREPSLATGQKLVDEKAFLQPQFGELVCLAASLLDHWPTENEARSLDERLASLKPASDKSLDVPLWTALALLRRVQTSQLAETRSLSRDWEPTQLPSNLQGPFAQAFVNAIDATRNGSPAGWCKALQYTEINLQPLLEKSDASGSLAALRIAIWLGNTGALERLREVASLQKRNGSVQLQLAEALAESDSSQSTLLAKQVAAGTKANSETHLAARWRILKNQIQNKQEDQARQSAQLLIASHPNLSEVWYERFSKIANGK